MAKIWILVVCCLASFPFSCCDNSSDTLTDSANCFTLNMYKEMIKGKSNVISSPFSVDVLLSMLYVGAGGKTAQELSQALGYNGISLEDLQGAFHNQLSKVQSINGNTLDLATSIWIQNGLNVNTNFRNVTSTDFLSRVYERDFRTQSAKATHDINNWTNASTNGLIPTLFDSNLQPSTLMVLANAMYFNGTWLKQFQTSDTTEGTFTSAQGSSSSVQFMYQSARFNYKFENALNSQVLEMFYRGKDISMIILLPKDDSSLEKLEQSLTCGSLKGATESLHSKLVQVTMPKFEIKSEFDLKVPLENVGINDIFKGSANLSGISPGIMVSEAIQKSVVKVHEAGTEAAVVTGILLMKMSAGGPPEDPVQFTANHPFLFLIQDKRTGLILFIGRVMEL